MARHPCLEIFAFRDELTSRIDHKQVEVSVCAHPAVVPPQLKTEVAATCRHPHEIVGSLKLDLTVAICVGVLAQPNASMRVPRRVYPRDAALYCTIHAPKGAVFARRRAIPGAIEHPSYRMVDDLHALGNHPIHRVV